MLDWRQDACSLRWPKKAGPPHPLAPWRGAFSMVPSGGEPLI
jgi:hypothetical protein